MERLRADAVVIGSGAGGAPTAAVLAEAGLEVLVLEAGPRFAAADFSADEAAMRSRLGRMTASADGGQNFYAGACVGGSTVVNDALCWRPPPEVLAAWRDDHGLSELTEAAFAPFVERAWRDVHAEPTGRSHLNRNARHLRDGARALGWAGEAMPRNVRGCARLGRCNFGCPIDAKQSMLVTYVPRAERAGARVVASARAERIRVEAGAVTGVDVARLDPDTGTPLETLRVDAPRVCVAAGALETPALLLRSGLSGRGTAGSGFQCHSSVYVAARFPEPVHGYFGPTMAFAISEFSDVNGGGGPGFMLENVAVHPLAAASALPGFGDEHARAMAALPHLGQTVLVLRDRTRGAIRIDGDGRTRVEHELLPEDVSRLREGVAAIARAYLAAGAEEVFLPVEGSSPVTRDAELAAFAAAPLDRSRLTLLYAVHLFSGAAMGASAERGFCTADGAAWDVRGLFVTDASSLPSNTGVNPQITVIANALRIAEGVAESAT